MVDKNKKGESSNKEDSSKSHDNNMVAFSYVLSGGVNRNKSSLPQEEMDRIFGDLRSNRVKFNNRKKRNKSLDKTLDSYGLKQDVTIVDDHIVDVSIVKKD